MNKLKLLAFFKRDLVMKLTGGLALLSHQNRLRNHLTNSLNPMAIRHLLSANDHLLSANRYLLIAISYLLINFTLFNNQALAQSPKDREAVAEVNNHLVVGKKVPEEFWRKEHLFYINGDTVRKTLEEHKGKMVVLDFWFSGCSPCLLHQNDIKSYVDQYPNDLVVVMVNSIKTKEVYDKINSLHSKGHFEKYGIVHFESIIEDQYLASLFQSTSYPDYVWINSIGVVQLRTFRNLLDKHYVAPFIDIP